MTKIIFPELSYQIQGAFYDVYNVLRSTGLSEAGWEKALLIAFTERGIVVHDQVEYSLWYKDVRVGQFFVDLIAEEKILIELKATDKCLPIDQAQVLTYLRVTDLQLGMIANFHAPNLQVQMVRVP